MSSTITLKDLKSIESALKLLPDKLSEYSAANLYLFRDLHNYRLEGDFISGVTRDNTKFYLPLKFPFKPEKKKLYFPLSEKMLDEFDEKKIKKYFLEADEDYLFEKKGFEDMAGGKLASRRSLIYRFEDDYDPKIIPLDKKGALKVLEAWENDHRGPSDFESCKEAIELFEKLNLSGLSVMSGRKHVGFIISENYRPDAALFHFCKALPHVKGVTPFLYRAMAARLPAKIKWINLEQDLGLAGLRKAKSAYQPAQKLKKFYLHLNT